LVLAWSALNIQFPLESITLYISSALLNWKIPTGFDLNITLKGLIPPFHSNKLHLPFTNTRDAIWWRHVTGGNNIYDSCGRMYTIQRHKFLLNVINDIFFNRWFEEIWLVIWQRLDFKQTFNIFISFHYIVLTYIRIKWMSLMIFSGEKQLMHSSIKVNYYTSYCRQFG
jgi:hypothetical protein